MASRGSLPRDVILGVARDHPGAQGLARDPQELSGSGLVAPSERDDVIDVRVLDLLERPRAADRHPGGGGTAGGQGDLLATHGAPGKPFGDSRDRLPEFAHVTRPAVPEQAVLGVRREAEELTPVERARLGEEVAGQRQDVAGAAGRAADRGRERRDGPRA